MKALWIGQQYYNGLRECVFIDDDAQERSTFYATDEQAREFAAENDASITADVYTVVGRQKQREASERLAEMFGSGEK